LTSINTKTLIEVVITNFAFKEGHIKVIDKFQTHSFVQSFIRYKKFQMLFEYETLKDAQTMVH